MVQHYAWGGYTYIPSLLGINNQQQKPFAEYWLGAHPSHPSVLEDQSSLADFLKKNPISRRESPHGESETIPFLFKILDVKKMLSIQVHPDSGGAMEGFDAEERAGIPLNASNRNYKDRNHKPELMVALSDFYLLHGFKSEEKMKAILDLVPELNFLKPVFQNNNYKDLYETLMRLPQEKVNTILQPLAERITVLNKKEEFKKDDENFWAARAIREFCRNGHYDRGIFSIYLFNLVRLKKGEGIFQDHGLPHAYLEGRNVEVMANSDNVLRAGLTEKNIDVEELLKHVVFDRTIPRIIEAGGEEHNIYPAPVKEFELHHFRSGEDFSLECGPGEIAWLEEGVAGVEAEGVELHLEKGESLFISRDTVLRIRPAENISLYRVLIPGG